MVRIAREIATMVKFLAMDIAALAVTIWTGEKHHAPWYGGIVKD